MTAMFQDTQPAALGDDGESDRWANFRVDNPAEVRALLTQIMNSSTPVNLSSPEGVTFSSQIWALDAAQRRVSFSASKDDPKLQRLIDGDEAVAVCYLEAVKLQFDLNHMMMVHGVRASAMQAALPQTVYRFQRRGSYRVRTVERDGPLAELRHPALPDMRLQLRVMDVSAGGCALFLPDNIPTIEPGLTLHGVLIELDTDTHFTATLQLRHVATIQPGARGARLGCEFLGLSPSSQRYLQMYIDQTQKRRRFLTLE
jgi:flagellar brake protein